MTQIMEHLSEAVKDLVSLVLDLRQEVSELRTKLEVEKSVASRLREELAEKDAPKSKK